MTLTTMKTVSLCSGALAFGLAIGMLADYASPVAPTVEWVSPAVLTPGDTDLILAAYPGEQGSPIVARVMFLADQWGKDKPAWIESRGYSEAGADLGTPILWSALPALPSAFLEVSHE